MTTLTIWTDFGVPDTREVVSELAGHYVGCNALTNLGCERYEIRRGGSVVHRARREWTIDGYRVRQDREDLR